MYNYTRQYVYVRCMDDDCRRMVEDGTKQRVMFAVEGPSEPENNASLHDCAHLITFAPGDDYEAEEMHPYPIEPGIYGIGARMGLGEMPR